MHFSKIVILLALLVLASCDHKRKKAHRLKHKSKGVKHRTSDQLVEIEIENGVVRGSKLSNRLYGFRGIPYAKVPVGDLRFEAPKEPEKWNGIWNATYDRNECIQNFNGIFSSPANITGSEDCLYINVYIPELPSKDILLPVMVWVYGGGFINGNSSYSNYGPDYLVQEDVIVVSFNYRLGIFGFLSTNDKAAPGNSGLKDQILALKWVQSNIKAFGGDPTNVTVFGESAGAASVSFLVLSPLAKGLFKNAIMESGTALCPWAISKTARDAAFIVGVGLGITASNSSSLVRQLKKVPAYQLQAVSWTISAFILAKDPLNGLVYAPVIEPPSDDAVVVGLSYELLNKGSFNQVPSIIGYNSAEVIGLSGLPFVLQLYSLSYDVWPARLVPADMNAAKSNLDRIGQLIKDHYAGSNDSLLYPRDDFSRYLSDNMFIRPVQKTASLTSKYSEVYLYRFSYTTNPNATGAGHADELPYIFNSDRNTTEDRKIRKCLVKLWTNFAKYNDPTPSNDICGGVSWTPIQPSDRNETYYIDINVNTTSGINPNKRDIDFWKGLYAEFGNRPYSTY